MKTAVSIPDEIFEQADRLARRTRKSRSQVYSEALSEYLARHTPDEITEAMNRALDDLAEPPDEVILKASRKTVRRVPW